MYSFKMRGVILAGVQAFRRALELAAGERTGECCHMPFWEYDLARFPRGSYELASQCLAQYLKERESSVCTFIIFMRGNSQFHVAEKASVHSHVNGMMDGEYIDLTSRLAGQGA